MALHAATIFLGAFLLFQVQPLMGKYLLPWFGGGPGVWTTCLLFFQGLLLGGYAYAHWLSTRVPVRRQAIVHMGLLFISLAFLPVQPDASWKPGGTEEPVARILLTLAATVGLPYLVLSATGPLLQRWFSLVHPGTSPYRLYALSNAGSLLALLTFPFVFEPLASRTALGWGWSAGLVLFFGLCAACARKLYTTSSAVAGVANPGVDEPGSATPATTSEPQTPDPESGTQNPDPRPETQSIQTPLTDRLFWLALPATASLLLVATTNKMCLDIAAVPFLWILPLAAYLLTFILCFDHPRWYSRRWFSALLVAGSFGVLHCLSDATVPMPLQVTVYVLTLFAGCMVAHGELYRLRPPPHRLTGFYLTIAAGGAAGSMAVALLAPLVFPGYYELQLGLALLVYLVGSICLLYRSRSLAVGTAIGLVAGLFVIPALQAEDGLGLGAWLLSWSREVNSFFIQHKLAIAAGLVQVIVALRQGWRVGAGPWQRKASAVPLVASFLLGVLFMVQAWRAASSVYASGRNFYGAYRIHLYHEDNKNDRFILLAHGGTTHGLQFSQPSLATWATSYYAATSGAGRALDAYPGNRHIGVVGLGSGSLAVYGRPGDRMRFYEIDPAIMEVAKNQFTYLRDSAADKIEIVPGDARLALEAELRRGEKQQFDLLLLDAFSGDAIPVHLLTREAMAVYLQHLRPGGVMAIHISNRHLKLRPVVADLARHNQLHFATINDSPEKDDWWLYPSTWMLVTADPHRLKADLLKTMDRDETDDTLESVVWTDDHASLLDVLK